MFHDRTAKATIRFHICFDLHIVNANICSLTGAVESFHRDMLGI